MPTIDMFNDFRQFVESRRVRFNAILATGLTRSENSRYDLFAALEPDCSGSGEVWSCWLKLTDPSGTTVDELLAFAPSPRTPSKIELTSIDENLTMLREMNLSKKVSFLASISEIRDLNNSAISTPETLQRLRERRRRDLDLNKPAKPSAPLAPPARPRRRRYTSQTDVGTRGARKKVRRFVIQHVTAWLKDSSNEKKLSSIEAWLLSELKSFYDATLIELLAVRLWNEKKSGQETTDLFNQSLSYARAYHHKECAHWDTIVDARNELRQQLANTTPERLPTLLSLFIDDWRSIIRDLSRVLSDVTLREKLPVALKRASELALDDVSAFESIDAITQITHVAAHEGRKADSCDDLRAAAGDAAQFFDTQRRAFLRDRLSTRPSRGQGSVEVWEFRRDIEREWWSLVATIAADATRRVADFMYGRTFSAWNIGDSEEPPRIAELRIAASDGADATKARTVAVLGAGIAGLTAAHELAERGFKVVVYEAIRAEIGETGPQVGGVARTQYAPPSVYPPPQLGHASAPPPVPGEHGYRFFPSFYRHIFDTMKRTPLRTSDDDLARRTAFDQLVPTFQQVFARRSDFVRLSRTRPRSIESFRQEYMRLVDGLGFRRRDISRFFFKLVRYLTTSTARRAAEYENMNFLDFLGGEGFYDQTFVDAIKAAPKALVAMDAEHCDARTQGNVYLQLLMDQVLGGDYVDGTLVGPTSKAWLIHWRNHLEGLNVTFKNAKVLSVEGDDSNAIRVILEAPPGFDASDLTVDERKEPYRFDYLVVALDPVAAEEATAGWNLPGVPKELRGFASHVDKTIPGMLDRFYFARSLDPARPRAEVARTLVQVLERIQTIREKGSGDSEADSAFRLLSEIAGELVTSKDLAREYRLVLWLRRRIGDQTLKTVERVLTEIVQEVDGDEAWLRLINDEPEWTEGATIVSTPRLPADRYGDTPDDRFQTFTGIQYYFTQDFRLIRGHVYFPETDWGLSAISQSQFWAKRADSDELRGVLSIDIGDCRARSAFTGKSLMESTPDEIAEEVWRQIEDSLRTTRGPTATITSLPLPQPIYYHLDDNLVFVGRKGPMRANKTPFLINNAGDWERRPRCLPWVPGTPARADAERTDAPGVWQAPHGGYRVHAHCAVFCGAYMRTFTRMTTMEAANESARHAVNAILDHLAWSNARPLQKSAREAISGDYCEIWDIEQHELEDLEFLKRVDERLFRAGKPHMADILEFDKLADLQHPELSSGQALLTAVGATLGKDWGVRPDEVMGALSRLFEIGRQLVPRAQAVTARGGDSPIGRLMAALGIGGAQR